MSPGRPNDIYGNSRSPSVRAQGGGRQGGLSSTQGPVTFGWGGGGLLSTSSVFLWPKAALAFPGGRGGGLMIF